jgi:tripartite-type tricarboxylate transporter receptor subunit TctC
VTTSTRNCKSDCGHTSIELRGSMATFEKTMTPFKTMFSTVLALAWVASIPIASAEVYPSRPVTIVVPFPAGGATDLTARLLADRMRGSLGQPVIVENVTGAGGTLAVSRAVRAAPDGHTLSLGDLTSHVSSSIIFPVTYDVLKDLEPVGLVASVPQLLVGRPTIPARNLSELIVWLKTNADKATMALPGALGSGGHLSAIELQSATGAKFQIVPYRGATPALQDLIAGHVDLLFANASTALPYVRDGKIKVYGVTTKDRWSAAPDIPTMNESGLKLYFALWQALWVPKGTPKEIIAKLSAAVIEALADAEVRTRFATLGQDIPARDQQTSDTLRAFHKAEFEKWLPVIEKAKITPN